MSESKQGIMDRFQGFMEEKILPFATKLGNQRHMAAIRDGMSILIPFTCWIRKYKLLQWIIIRLAVLGCNL